MDFFNKKVNIIIDSRYICRICCIKSCEQDMVSLQENVYDSLRYLELIMLCFPVEISDDDKLPNFICNSCKVRLIDTYNLRTICLETDQKLRDSLSSVEIEQLGNNTYVQEIKSEDEVLLEIENEPGNAIVQDGGSDFDDEEHFDLGSYDVKAYEDIANKIISQNITEPQPNNTSQEVNEKLNLYPIEKVESTADPELNTTVAEDNTPTSNIPKPPTKRKSRIKRTKNNHKCEICGKIFDKAYRLLRHANVHNPVNRPYECEICHHRFQSETSLVRHAIVHSDLIIDYTTIMQPPEAREFKCMECDKVFSKQESLSSHLKTHKEKMSQKEYKCDYCPKVFKKLNLLTRHSRQHDELKIHQCNICYKTFALNSQLIDHINRHRGIKPHVCGVCGKGFQQSCTLKGNYLFCF